MTSYLIKGASILGERVTDILIQDGRVSLDGDWDEQGDLETIDATGLVALPGLVDLHTHLREPGREDAETVLTGTQAAAMGGFTAVHAMANTDPVADTAGVVEQVWRLGREGGYCDVYPVGAVTVGLGGEQMAELGSMADSAARVRVFSDDGKCVSDASLMRRALEYVKAFDGVIAQHALVMHPGPMNRGVEIAAEVADSPRSTIVEQVANGVTVRMAVLYLLLGGSESAIANSRTEGE